MPKYNSYDITTIDKRIILKLSDIEMFLKFNK